MERLFGELQLSSIPLRQIGITGMPINFASGCLINYGGKRVLLTVSHATDNNGAWALEVSSNDMVGTKLWKLGTMNFLDSLNLETGEKEKIDFSYVLVPDDINPSFHILDENFKIQKTIPRIIKTLNFDIAPSTEKKYGFAGNTMFKPNGFILESISRVVVDLKYIGMEGPLFKFKLPIKHPGHAYFKGTSGAPIMDEEGNVIALVSKGCVKEDVIYGIPLSHYKIPIDILIATS